MILYTILNTIVFTAVFAWEDLGLVLTLHALQVDLEALGGGEGVAHEREVQQRRHGGGESLVNVETHAAESEIWNVPLTSRLNRF